MKLRVVLAWAVMLFALVVPVAAASAQTADPYVTPPQVLGEDFSRAPASPAKVAPASVSRTSGLAVTGSDIAGLTVLGVVLVGVGVVLVRRNRIAVPAS